MGKTFTPGELLVITPKDFLFISQTDLVKYLQMPVNAINLKLFPVFTTKGHPRVFWVICIILQLQRTAIEKTRIGRINTINTIDMIDIINWNNQY